MIEKAESRLVHPRPCFRFHLGDVAQGLDEHIRCLRAADGILLVEDEEGNAVDADLLGGVDLADDEIAVRIGG